MCYDDISLYCHSKAQLHSLTLLHLLWNVNIASLRLGINLKYIDSTEFLQLADINYIQQPKKYSNLKKVCFRAKKELEICIIDEIRSDFVMKITAVLQNWQVS